MIGPGERFVRAAGLSGLQYSLDNMMVNTRTYFAGSLGSSEPCSMSGA